MNNVTQHVNLLKVITTLFGKIYCIPNTKTVTSISCYKYLHLIIIQLFLNHFSSFIYNDFFCFIYRLMKNSPRGKCMSSTVKGFSNFIDYYITFRTEIHST